MNKAIELFSACLDNLSAQYFLAQLFEYDLGDVDSINKAYSLYENISKTGDKELEPYIESAFVRLPIYKFIVELTDHMASMHQGKISYDTFCNLTNNINLSDIPPEISSAYLAFLPRLQETNMDFLSGFISGFTNPFKAAKDVFDSFRGVRGRDSDILWDKFISSLEKYKIGAKFFNIQNAKLK